MAVLVFTTMTGCSHQKTEAPGNNGASESITGSSKASGGQTDSNPKDKNIASITQKPGAPIDGKILLEELIAAYQNAKSMQISTNAYVKLNFGPTQEFNQESLLKFQREPGQLYMNVKDPASGTHILLADGTSLISYTGLTNQYTRRSLGSDLIAICRKINQEIPQTMAAPLFLISKGMPLGISTAKYIHNETVNGTSAQIVRGAYNPSYLADLGKNIFHIKMSPGPGSCSYEVAIDPNTHLLLRSTIHLVWNGMIQDQKGRKVPFTPMIDITETVTNCSVNPRFSNEEFRFTIPKGATEKFIEGSSDL